MINTSNIFDIEQSFKQSLASIGHPLIGEMKFDTENWQRFDCPHSSKGNANVAYKAHSDGFPVIKIQCNKCHPEAHSFKFGGGSQPTPMQRQEMQIETEKRKKAELAKRDVSLKTMRAEWDRAKPCLTHPYFDRKGLSITEADGLRLDGSGRVWCPVRLITGELVSTQSIPSEGKKLFYSGVSPKNGFHVLGAIEAHDTIFFGEGIATCLSIRNIVQKPVICVYGKHFSDIAPIIAKAYPDKQFVYCCDFPSQGEKVTSEDDAKKAITLVGGSICLPDFSIIPADLKPEIARSDFNDLYCLLSEQGKTNAAVNDVLRQQIQNSIQCENSNMNGDSTQKENAQSEGRKPANDSGSTDGDMDNVTPIKITIKKADYPECINIRDGKKPLNTYGNLKYMLDRLGIIVRWNDMSRIREVKTPDSSIFYDDEENSALREVINLATLNNMPTSNIDDHLNTLAQQNHYHPIVESINKKPWDNVPRLDQFIRTLKTTDKELSYKLIHRWMLSAIAAAYSERGVASQGVLVLQGKQNIGKTGWVKALDPINCNAVKEGALLDPSNKDTIITCASHWIVELGELDATFRKADIARLKSHITNQFDIVRFPYARKNSRLPRRTAYIATVNEGRYLIDDTGNRRWWTVEVESIDFSHGLDMQQVWAEVYHLWEQGEKHWLNQEELELLNESNIEHEQIDPFEEKVLEYFDWDMNWQSYNTEMTATQVLQAIGCDNPSKAQATRMGNIIMKLTGKSPKRRKHTLPRRNPSCTPM